MKVIIYGAGRMGIRHAIGALGNKNVTSVAMVDISQEALNSVRDNIDQNDFDKPLELLSVKEISGYEEFEVGIIAVTADIRLEIVKELASFGCKNILIEKPLGQNIQQVSNLIEYSEENHLNCYVNLNMRLYESFIKLKSDLNTVPQLLGFKNISINTGAVGIGANAIHYIDLVTFLTDSNKIVINAAYIDENKITSGRGEQFCDFGGWINLDYFNNESKKANCMISVSPLSTVFGNWNFVCSNGLVTVDEFNQKRINRYRDINSTLPIHRYNGDYTSDDFDGFISPELSELTSKWIDGIINGEEILPTIDESLMTHKIIFEWLEQSKVRSNVFQIT